MENSWNQVKSRITYQNIALTVFLIIVLSVSVLFGASYYMEQVNDATQERNTRHVTNWSCGVETPDNSLDYNSCPGELECYHIGEYEPKGEEQETRCVEPEYVENFCGKYSNTMILQSFPPYLSCNPDYHVTDLVQQITENARELT